MAAPLAQFERIGIIGAGSMGSNMSLGLAENGFDISLWDIRPENVRHTMEQAQQTSEINMKITGFNDITAFGKSFKGARKLIILSISHGTPVDEVLGLLTKQNVLQRGDIVLDGGNEHWRVTERRQKSLEQEGIFWIGLGVSGGYQSARRGPSLSPGGDRKTIEEVLPVLEKFSAKAERKGATTPCVEYIGPRGSGHFVKMVHNGIENGELGAICEAWSWLRIGLELSEDEIGEIFQKWNTQGELRGNFLLQIGSDICHRRQGRSGERNGNNQGSGHHVVNEILDKVVQDDDDTEGTGYWSVMEAAENHVSAPTISAAQFLRVSSGNRAQRVQVSNSLKLGSPKPATIKEGRKEDMIERLRRAVYATILSAYCQGLELIARVSQKERWNLDLAVCIRIWRAGCIIQSDHIADLLEPILTANSKSENPSTIMNLKLIQEVAIELQNNFGGLKETVLQGTISDAYMPTLSATLEYLKYESGKMLPTQFMEAEMDFFGAHGYDKPGRKGEDPGQPSKGKHHYEWKAA